MGRAGGYARCVRTSLPLNSAKWTLRLGARHEAAPVAARGIEIAAQLPGCVHVDLLAAGLIADPAVSMHEHDVQWIGECDWEYRCEFAWGARERPALGMPQSATSQLASANARNDRVELVLDGLDTFARVLLNDAEIGRAESMYFPHRFSLNDCLRPGTNQLVIELEAPLRAIRERAARFGPRPVNGDWEPYNFARRPACNFGWDWGPKVATCGVWGGASIERWSVARLGAVRPIVTLADERSATLDVHADFVCAHARQVRVRVELRDSRGAIVACGEAACSKVTFSETICNGPAGESRTASCRLALEKPELWWPCGHGSQSLYSLRVSLHDTASGDVLDAADRRVGIRVIELDTSRDGFGEKCELHVNKRRVFLRGANWIPEGLWPMRVSDAMLRERVGQAAAASMNALRVWGGGWYERDAFYDACDELGLLVWQDFMFACAMYPEEQPYHALVEREARHQVGRLSAHPSVALWCGGNECVWGYESWGWRQRLLPAQSWGEGFYFGLLPNVVRELDPSRPYWANSPWSRDGTREPNTSDRGDRHTWDGQGNRYRDRVPRACTEFGHQSPSLVSTLREVIPACELRLGSAEMTHRQRATGGDEPHHLAEIRRVFGEARDFEHWNDLALRAQARSISIGVEWLRANQPRCSAALIWQLNDAWAGLSWSLIDAAGRLKPAWHAAKRSMSPRLLTIQPLEQRPTLIAVNDLPGEAWFSAVIVRRIDFDGRVLGEATLSTSIEALSVRRLGALDDLVGATSRPWREIVTADAPGVPRSLWLYRQDRELQDSPAEFTWGWRESTSGGVLAITATSLLRDVVIHADRAEPAATCMSQLVTLAPGESHEFEVRGWRGDPSRLIEHGVMTTSRAAAIP